MEHTEESESKSVGPFRYGHTSALQRIEASLTGLIGRARSSWKFPSPSSLSRHSAEILAFTRSYHAKFDRYLAEILAQGPGQVRCGPGCSNCCHHFPMSVEPFELIALYLSLRRRDDFFAVLEACASRVAAFHSCLEESSRGKDEWGEEEEDLALHQYFSKGLPCPFLTRDGSCGIHAIRPATCRMYFSYSDPGYCVPEHLASDANEAFILQLPDPLEDALAELSAQFASLDLPESLYAGLLACNALESEIRFSE